MSKLTEAQEDQVLIQQVTLDANFRVMANFSVEDPNLTWQAKGLLWYIVSRPQTWKVYVSQLIKIYTGQKKGSGKQAIRSMLKELKEAGYLTYELTRGAKGQWKHIYKVYPLPFSKFKEMGLKEIDESPCEKHEIQKKIPESVKPVSDNSAPENDNIIVSNNKTRNDLIKKESSSSKSPPKVSAPKKSLRSEDEDLSAYKFLDETTLSPKEKARLRKDYAPDDLEKALKISKTQEIKKNLMCLLIHILKNPHKWDEIDSNQTLTTEQKKALQWNEKLATIYPNTAKENEESIIKQKSLMLYTSRGWEKTLLYTVFCLEDIKNAESVFHELVEMKARKT